MSFKDKVVLVTGAGSGMGASIADAFAKEDAHVVLVDKNEGNLKKTAKKMETISKKILAIEMDVSKEDDVTSMFEKVMETFKKLDILVNNAGVTISGSILDGNLLKAYDNTMSVNLRAVIHLTSLAAPYLIKTKGSIINVSSVGSLYVTKRKELLPYIVSKAGLDHFTRGAASELAPFGVRVNAVNPGPVKTDFLINNGYSEDEQLEVFKILENVTPLKKMSEPEEIADLVLFLASDKAKSITGSLYLIDNGLLLNPIF